MHFEDYFTAYKNRKEYISSQVDIANKIDFSIDSYTEVIDKLKKSRPGKQFFRDEKKLLNNDNLNGIAEQGVFDTIIEFLLSNSNVLLYGYGSKLKFIYNFINHFQEKVNVNENENFHLLVFNCYNPELTIKHILTEILSYLLNQLEILGNVKDDLKDLRQRKFKNTEEQIFYIDQIRKTLVQKEICAKYLLIFNNIDGPNFQTKTFQTLISLLISVGDFLFLATSDNLYVNYFWTQTIKDNFSFYFLKYHSLCPYELEINNMNSLSNEKNLKAGRGLEEVMRSLTKNQRDVIKVMAEIQIKGDMTVMTPKALVDFMVDNGLGICNNQNRFMELILEPIDHEIIVEKLLPRTNKLVYKINLDTEVVEKIIGGQFDFDDNFYNGV